MRRFVTSSITIAALAASGLVVAPTASAAVDPTVVSASAAPKKILIQIGGSAQTTMSATFNDPDATIYRAEVTVLIPGGGKYGPYTYSGTTAGDSRIFDIPYTASNSNPPGKYRVKFEALPNPGITYSVTPIARTTFVVQHRTRIVQSNNPWAPHPGYLMKFYGLFYPQNPGVKRKTLTLWFQPKGQRKFTKVDTTQVSKLYKYNFGKIRVKKSGKYRVKFAGTKFLRPTKSTVVFTVY
jgi:hypothetical protein